MKITSELVKQWSKGIVLSFDSKSYDDGVHACYMFKTEKHHTKNPT